MGLWIWVLTRTRSSWVVYSKNKKYPLIFWFCKQLEWGALVREREEARHSWSEAHNHHEQGIKKWHEYWGWYLKGWNREFYGVLSNSRLYYADHSPTLFLISPELPRGKKESIFFELTGFLLNYSLDSLISPSLWESTKSSRTRKGLFEWHESATRQMFRFVFHENSIAFYQDWRA